ncbi:MAG TPA: Gfo/Idh/MocA family oxidoreductase [Terracidiphilus sp.]|jgi:predicted dehydrogenase|nr:Gfo/Idh/MocA family oxidoreductase [Terracidiphilus sp.]
MQKSQIKVGIIGAGAIVRQRHLPKLKTIPGVEVTVVCNRHLESASSVAKEFQIPEATDDWRRVVDRGDIDVIWIGTNPHMHAEITTAGLNAGKHVFCQARMARDVEEARRMLESAQLHPKQVTMLCPPPNGMKHGLFLRELIDRGEIGSLYHFSLRSFTSAWADRDAAAHWRQRIEISGNNILSVGIYAEVLGWLLGDPIKLCAQGRVCTDYRGEYRIQIPDMVQVIGDWPGELKGALQWSGVAQFGGTDTLEVFGSEGTLKYDFGTDEVMIGRRGAKELENASVPPEYVRQWTVEEDFIRAVRDGGKPEPSFEAGVRYMKFVEAVTESMRRQARVDLETI